MTRKKKKQADARTIFAETLELCATQLEELRAHMNSAAGAEDGIDMDASRALSQLATAVNSMTKTQEAINAKGMAQVGTMSVSEMFDVCMRFLTGLPHGYRQKAADIITPTLKKGAA